MRILIKGWTHIPGKHCGSAAIRDVMHFYGVKISEEMCFGIGAGLGFYYFKNPAGSPSRFIMVRSAGMENNFFRHINQDFRWHVGDKDALNKVKGFLKNGTPVLLQTDIYYLKYYNSKTHFAGHVIVAWGYSDEERKLFVSDTGFDGLQEVSYDDIERAWVRSIPPFYVDHNWGEVLKPDSLNIKDAITASIITQASELTQSVFGSSAMNRLKQFASTLPQWAEEPDWKWCARFAYQVIEKRGTGGGAFRLMYAKFLEESRQIIPEVFSAGVVSEMYEIAENWRKLAMLFKEISESETPGSGFKECARIAGQIAEREEKIFKAISQTQKN